jgi:tetratricopeptide (TPR) repeat protein
MNIKNNWLLFIITMFIVSCGSTSKPEVAKKTINKSQTCGVTRGSFLGGWFDYYERGLSFADCAMWVAAQADLEKALKLRNQDKRRVYTLGMHFITNYFPNRELGIIFYQQGDYEQAEKYLLLSISQFPSTKAETYLNKSRVKLPKYQLDEKTSPNISVISNSTWSNSLGRRLQLKISDDTFIEKVWVDGKEIIWQDIKLIDKTPISIKSAKPEVNVDSSIQSTAPEIII